MNPPTPILILSDAPDQTSGLARITRDLCTVLTGQPEWRVASFGAYGVGSSRLPWQQYHMRAGTQGEYDLPNVWNEFAYDQPGIVLTIWDLSRLGWLARSDLFDSPAREWLAGARGHRFRLWGYVPVDSTGPGGRLTAIAHDTLLGFDRLLAYTPWGEDVIRQTIGTEEAMNRGLTWLPHGYNGDTFKPDKNGGGAVEDVAGCPQTGDDPARVTRIGVVATNQARKDWGLVAAIARGLAAVRSDIRWWIHTDQIIREWSLPALIDDFRLTNVDVTVAPMSDAELARRYRECALTIAPGAGEGFGYPIVESLACGVPVLHGDYAGGASIMRTCGRADMLIQPDTYRVEGQYNCVRPVHDPEILVECVNAMLSTTIIDTVASVEHLRWMNLAYPWRRWFREGVR